ncbi:MAG: DUF2950 family protein [Planctomycetota bacterium]|nr:DUF2950 family protein [Planctomycetota bacterium]
MKDGTKIYLMDLSFAMSEGVPGGLATPKAGYVVMVQPRYVDAVSGQTGDYRDGSSNMTAGYGLSAAPYIYDSSGRSNYQINLQGTVFQKDFGDSTRSAAAHTNVFTALDPNATDKWAPCE